MKNDGGLLTAPPDFDQPHDRNAWVHYAMGDYPALPTQVDTDVVIPFYAWLAKQHTFCDRHFGLGSNSTPGHMPAGGVDTVSNVAGIPEETFDKGQWFTFAIGAVVVSANLADVAVGTLYAAVLNSDMGATVAYGQPFSATVDSCLAALSALPAHELFDEARTLLADARPAYEKRNQIAHGSWQVGVFVDDPRAVVRFKRGGRVDSRKWTQPELMALADQLVGVAERINDVAMHIQDHRRSP